MKSQKNKESAEKKIIVKETFAGKPEDIKRLYEVQRRLIEISKRSDKKRAIKK